MSVLPVNCRNSPTLDCMRKRDGVGEGGEGVREERGREGEGGEREGRKRGR